MVEISTENERERERRGKKTEIGSKSYSVATICQRGLPAHST